MSPRSEKPPAVSPGPPTSTDQPLELAPGGEPISESLVTAAVYRPVRSGNSLEDTVARLMQTIVTFERTMDVAPVLDFLRSVQITAKLSVNPQYQSALRDAESESWDEPGTDVRAMIEAANERRRAAQGQAR